MRLERTGAQAPSACSSARNWALWGDTSRLDALEKRVHAAARPPTAGTEDALRWPALRLTSHEREQHLRAVQTQRAAWHAHVGAMTWPQVAQAFLWRALRVITSPRAVLYWPMHPAAICSEVVFNAHPLARQVTLWADDHTLLDGVLLAPVGQHAASLPVLLLALGNGDQYEDYTEFASRKACQHGIRVLLYNGRGVGRSLGNSLSTRDAVRDCAAAMRYATHLSPDIAVSAYSLGAGLTARATEQLQQSGALQGIHIGLCMLQNSFESLSHAAGEFVARLLRLSCGAAIGRLLRLMIQLSGGDPLDTAAIIARVPLAEQVIVSYVKDDPVILPGARLQDALRRSPQVAANIDFVWEEDLSPKEASHGRTLLHMPEFDAAISKWLDQVQSRHAHPASHASAASPERRNR